MSKQSRSRRNQPETPQTNWLLPSTAPLTPAPQPSVARNTVVNTIDVKPLVPEGQGSLTSDYELRAKEDDVLQKVADLMLPLV